VSRPKGEEGWLPVEGRPRVCRRGGCGELATDPEIALCVAHRRLRPTVRADRLPARLVDLPKALSGPGPWALLAACRDSPLDFFAEGKDRASLEKIEAAKEVCRDCKVGPSCLAAGLRERYGVWGGMDVRERKRLRQRRQQAA
jgi:hypothetical protein